MLRNFNPEKTCTEFTVAILSEGTAVSVSPPFLAAWAGDVGNVAVAAFFFCQGGKNSFFFFLSSYKTVTLLLFCKRQNMCSAINLPHKNHPGTLNWRMFAGLFHMAKKIIIIIANWSWLNCKKTLHFQLHFGLLSLALPFTRTNSSLLHLRPCPYVKAKLTFYHQSLGHCEDINEEENAFSQFRLFPVQPNIACLVSYLPSEFKFELEISHCKVLGFYFVYAS